MHQTIAYYWERSVPRLSQYPGFKEQFTVDGRAPRKGELWRSLMLFKSFPVAMLSRHWRRARWKDWNRSSSCACCGMANASRSM